jgi:RNA polymerase-binding transcription factor DksA
MIKKKTPAKKATKAPIKKPKAPERPSKAVKKAPAKTLIKQGSVNKKMKTAAKEPAKSATKVSPKKSKAKSEHQSALRQVFIKQPTKKNNTALSPFLAKQKNRLLKLKDTLLDSMKGVARDNLHAGSETSAFGMHQADAGSDAYDRDFALSILSQEQNSLYEIDEALKRIDDGSYGVCEISNKQIPRARLEARPFTRYTVECQADLEKRQHVVGTRLPVSALFGLTEEESENEEEDNLLETTKD